MSIQQVLPGSQAGFTAVKLKNGQEICVQATENEILEATAEE